MPRKQNRYANYLQNYRILYIPTCVIIEMMTRAYSQISQINPIEGEADSTKQLFALLHRFLFDIRCTSKAYQDQRIRFFIGDWREDKYRAERIFTNLMSRLRYLAGRLENEPREMLLDSSRALNYEWDGLGRILAARSARDGDPNGKRASCRYFRSLNASSWQHIMANIILTLDAKAEYEDEDTYLLLLCYSRIRNCIIRKITEMKSRTRASNGFDPEKILCVSNEDIPISCPSCMKMTESHNQFTAPRRIPGTRAYGYNGTITKIRHKTPDSTRPGPPPRHGFYDTTVRDPRRDNR